MILMYVIATYIYQPFHSAQSFYNSLYEYPFEIDLINVIQVIDRSFGFDTAVEEAQRAINAAHVEAESCHNGIGLVKLMGRHSGKHLRNHGSKPKQNRGFKTFTHVHIWSFY